MVKLIYGYTGIGLPVPKISFITCKRCGNNLTNAPHYLKYYGCNICDAWVTEVDIKSKLLTALNTEDVN